MAFAARSALSLEDALSSVGGSTTATIWLRAGVYHLDQPLVVAGLPGELVIQACPGESAIIEGPAAAPSIWLKDARHVTVSGLVFSGPSTVQVFLDGAADCTLERNTFLQPQAAILLDHARSNRVVRNVISRVAASGIELKDGSDANIIADNVIDGANAPETSGGAIFLHGADDNRIAYNLIQSTAGFGIGISNWDDATINTGNVVEYNYLRRTVLSSTDSGAIYVLGRSGVDTRLVIAGNVIDGVGSPGNHNVGIYLDDSTSGATVIGNVVRQIGSDALQIHGGQDNLIENNLFDLGADRAPAVLFQAAPADTNPTNLQTGNAVLRNIIISSNDNPRPFVWYDGGTPSISGNLYLFAEGAAIATDQPVTDQQPQWAEPPLLKDVSLDGYAAVQRAADPLIGFKPLDISSAGVRAVRR